jgi:hypothetical protein
MPPAPASGFDVVVVPLPADAGDLVAALLQGAEIAERLPDAVPVGSLVPDS